MGLSVHGHKYYMSSSNMIKELLMRNRFSWYVRLKSVQSIRELYTHTHISFKIDTYNPKK